jgi:hypothetical protein
MRDDRDSIARFYLVRRIVSILVALRQPERCGKIC